MRKWLFKYVLIDSGRIIMMELQLLTVLFIQIWETDDPMRKGKVPPFLDGSRRILNTNNLPRSRPNLSY